MPVLIKKTLHHECLTGFLYSSGSEYTRILNMPVLSKVLKKYAAPYMLMLMFMYFFNLIWRVIALYKNIKSN